MEYTQNLINCSRDELLDQLKDVVKTKRFKHILRVEEKIMTLAEKHGVDLEKASIAALLHDFAKDLDSQVMRELARQYWDEPLLEASSDEIWHGFAAAQIAQEHFNVKDKSILTAVAGHTIGWFEMDQLFKILYLADYTEPGRDFPGVKKARKLAENDLDAAVTFKMSATIKHLIDKEQSIFLPTIDIYNCWISKI